MRLRFEAVSAVAVFSLTLVHSPALAQSRDAQPRADVQPSVDWPLPRVEWEGPGITAATKQQLAELEAAVRELADPRAARARGFRPALGMIPTMGEHWVNPRGMMAEFDRSSPPHLMFSLVNGEEQLVGAAYAFQRAPNAAIPDGFDGTADVWHEHAELAIGNQTLTMLHVWFVPSPDGPFAGHNPWLAFWAVGLEPPERAGMTHQPDDSRVRAVSLALAESYGSSVGGNQLARALGGGRGSLSASDEERRKIQALIPDLHRAQAEDDLEAWNRTADQMVSIWEGVQEARLAAIPVPLVRERLEAFYQEMLTGGHGPAEHAH